MRQVVHGTELGSWPQYVSVAHERCLIWTLGPCILPVQAASGAGAAAMEELRQQTQDVLDGKPAQPKIFPVQVGGRIDRCQRCQQYRSKRIRSGICCLE